jgi:hypothetical protein
MGRVNPCHGHSHIWQRLCWMNFTSMPGSCNAILCHVNAWIMLCCYVTSMPESCYAMLCYVMSMPESFYAMLCHVNAWITSCYVMLHQCLNHVMLCHVNAWITSCYVMLCQCLNHVMLCYVMSMPESCNLNTKWLQINYSLSFLLESRNEDIYRMKGILSIAGSDFRFVYHVRALYLECVPVIFTSLLR